MKRERFLECEVPWPDVETRKSIADRLDVILEEATRIEVRGGQQSDLIERTTDLAILEFFRADAGLRESD